MQLGSLHDKLLLGQGLTDKSKKMLLTNDIGPPAVPGRVLWNRACSSFRPSFRLPGAFLELRQFFFLIFGMVLETHMKLCVIESDGESDQEWTDGMSWCFAC